MNRPWGFSLIELVVVMVIAAILAALAIPRFTDSESKATWFHEQVKAGVRYAQRQAVAQRRCVFVSVSAAQLQLFYGDAACGITATPLTQLTTGAPYVLDAPTGVVMSAANFSFNGLGQPSPGVTFNVGGKPVTVTTETGYVP
jgi:MSHA pilin protein MshC